MGLQIKFSQHRTMWYGGILCSPQ